MNLTIETYILDSFTEQAFKGNPAAVCLLDESISPELMQNIAKELGLSETAFVLQLPSSKYSIRYFSPKMEIPLCGHATLAASKVLFDIDSSLNHIQFITSENLELPISKLASQIQMTFPVYNTIPTTVPKALLKALGIETYSNSAYNKETNILLLEITDSQDLRNLNPDFEALIASHDSINGVLVTAQSKTTTYDFESRYFWPWSGTNEDPVTGATHTFLSKYWGQKLNKTQMRSFQCSARTGSMDLELVNDHTLLIKSTAVVVLKGNLVI